MSKIFIYDFDGTLTPYSMVRYAVVNKCNVIFEEMNDKVVNYMNDNNVNIYNAYYRVLFDLMKSNDIDITLDNVCVGAGDIELSKGLIDYFKRYDNVKHYVVTSGLRDYITKTKISNYFAGIYGTIINYNLNASITKLVTDKDKVLAIKEIIENNNCSGSDIVYFGDGMTDKYAFMYVHEIGGKCIFIKNNDNNELENDDIDFVCNGDYSYKSELDLIVNDIINENEN